MALDPSTPRSRRAILAAAAGAAGAVVASAARPASVQAADGALNDDILIGVTFAHVAAQTTLGNQDSDDIVLWVASNGDSGFGGGTALVGYSAHAVGVGGGSGATPVSGSSLGVYGLAAGAGSGVKGESQGAGIGVIGYSAGGYGVHGTSAAATGSGVYGTSDTGSGTFGSTNSGTGVWGFAGASGGIGARGDSNASDSPAVAGRSLGNSTAVLGYSGANPLPSPKVKTGVYGYAAQDNGSKGVWGSSPAGHGIHGQSTSGWAGYFAGKVLTTKFHEMKEISVPTAPTANRARLFLRDNGSGKTQLCVRFSTGAIQVLATQP